MNNRVQHLDLKLKLPPELRERSWTIAQQLREGFITEVVERIAERLHAQFGPEALIEIPLLEVQWDANEQGITDFDHARKLGDELVDQLLSEFDDQNIDRVDIIPSADDGIRVYRSPAHKAAVTISAFALQQQRSASIENLNALELDWHGMCEQGSDRIADGLGYICNLGTADVVVESLSTRQLKAAVTIYPLSRWPQPIRSFVISRLLQTGSNVSEECEQEPHTERPVVKPLMDEGQQLIDKGNVVSSERIERAERTGKQETEATDSTQTTTSTRYSVAARRDDASESNRHHSSDKIESNTQAVEKFKKDDGHIESSLTDSASTETNDEQYSDVSLTNTNTNTNAMPIDGLPLSQQETAYAGLVYVLNLFLRIELPEILWCCGIDERSFLFDLCINMAGSGAENDPVLLAITGIDPDRSNYKPVVVQGWAWEEVVRKVYRNIDDRLTKNSQLEFHSYYSDADIDTIINKQKSETKDSWISLVDICDSLLLTAFRCVLSPDDSGYTFLNYIKKQGIIKESGDEVSVELPMESIDVDIRRAALDVNPGFLQWQHRYFIIIFTE